MEGKIVLITGGTDGLGLAAATQLAERGATVIVTGRNAEKATAAVKTIRLRSGNPRVSALLADFASLGQVRQLAQQVSAAHGRLDVLINNAGGFVPKYTLSADQYELMFGVNYLAPFLLTNLLLDLLKHSAPARIINVASLAYLFGSISANSLDGTQRGNAIARYGRSKLAVVLWTYELARRLAGSGVSANVVEPGLVDTSLPRAVRGPGRRLIGLLRPLMTTPERGAQVSVHLATAPELREVNGVFFGANCKPRATARPRDLALAQQLWQASTTLTALNGQAAPATLSMSAAGESAAGG